MEDVYLVDAYHHRDHEETQTTSVHLFGHDVRGASVCVEVKDVRTSTLLTWPFPIADSGTLDAVAAALRDAYDDREGDDAGELECDVETCREMNGFDLVVAGVARTRKFLRVSSTRRDVLGRVRAGCSYGRTTVAQLVEGVVARAGKLVPAEPDMDVVQEFLHDAKVRLQWIGCDLSRVPRMPMSHCAREAWVTEIQSAADPSRVPADPRHVLRHRDGLRLHRAARRTQYPQITDPNSAVTYIGVTQRDGAAPDRRVVLALAPAHDLAGDEACPVRSFRARPSCSAASRHSSRSGTPRGSAATTCGASTGSGWGCGTTCTNCSGTSARTPWRRAGGRRGCAPGAWAS